jgi:ABC-type nitrate/sulfonate/bicarbonate transport system substrate-binding protein
MKHLRLITSSLLVLFIESFTPRGGIAQDRIRVGVPLFPTVSYPVFIAHEKGIFEKNGLKVEIIRINSEPTTYQALISGTSMPPPARPPVWCNPICRACPWSRSVAGTT